MKPITLTLSGFIGIRAGLNRETLDLDLSTLAGDAKLVALVGPNGAGKSTVLDNLHPYRLQPSRAGGYSPGSFSYYDQIHGPEAKKELTWEHDGRRYRSILVFKAGGKTKKTEAYLFVHDGSEWRPAAAPDGTLSDGKTDTYDRIVEAILGTPEMFFTSAFSCQGRRSLSSYANGEIKGLLSELLGLDHIRELGVKARETGAGLSMRLESLRADLVRAAETDAGLEQARTDLAIAESALPVLTEERNSARAASSIATRRLADMQAEARGNTEIDIKRRDLGNRITQAEQRGRGDEEQANRDILAQRAASGRATEENGHVSQAMERQIAAAQAQIAQAETARSRAGDVEAAKRAAPDLVSRSERAEVVLAEAKRHMDAWRELKTEEARLTAALGGIRKEGEHMKAHCAGLSTRAGLIDTVPCKAMDIAGSCPLLADARTAKAGVDAAEAATQAKRHEYGQQSALLMSVASKLDALGGAAGALAQAEAEIRAAAQAIQANNAILALEATITQAAGIIAAAQANIAEWRQAIAAKQEATNGLVSECNQRIEAIEKRRDAGRAENAAEISRLEQERAALPPPADTTALTKAEQEATQAEGAMARAEQDLSAIHVRIGAAKERIAQLERAAAGLVNAKSQARELETEIGHWANLAKAFGNDGIIALSIDDAGPTLAAYANDLLLSCYGPRFSVSIRTQAETAKGDLKETFDIVVFDGDRGDEKSVRDMSGGERIWVNEALTRAIALYQGQMHGRHYECLFADESDGALDPERKAQFMRMKRKVMELGGYRQEIFISHTPELWEMADAVIDMAEFMQ